MIYNALEVSEFILSLCTQLGEPISNLKLQKILYYVQGYSLAQNNKVMFDDEIYAWKYGPVVPEVYNEFKIYASSPIVLTSDVDIEREDIDVIIDVIKDKLNVPVWELVRHTHEEDPWKYTNAVYGDCAVIPSEIIKSYFNDVFN